MRARRPVPLHRVRERVVESARFCRESDAAHHDGEGWRTLEDYRMAAGRGLFVLPSDVARVLDDLVEEGVMLSRDGSWRIADRA